MNTNRKTEKIIMAFVGLFLLSYFMMLFDFNNLLTVFLGGCICLIIWVKQKKIEIGIGNCFLIITVMSYYTIRFGVKEALFMGLPYVGIVMALLGVCLAREARNKVDYETIMYALLFLLILGFSIHGFLNSYMFFAGIRSEGERYWNDVWLKIMLPATEHIVYFLPMLTTIIPAIIFFKSKKIINLLYILSSVFFVCFSWRTDSRMPIVIFPIIMIAQICLYMILERNLIIRIYRSNKKLIKGFLIVGISCLIVFLITDNIVMLALKEKLGRSGGIFGNIRFVAQRKALEQLFIYPMGGSKMDLGRIAYAHNTWLDMANRAGLIPFFSFVIYTFWSVYEMIRWLAPKSISTERKLITAGIYGAFFLYYTVERGIEGSMHFMTPWFFINGMIHGELSAIRKGN